MGFAKLLIGWALSLVIYAVVIQAWYVASGRTNSGFAEGLLGLGILLAIPSLVFTLIVGRPTMTWLASLHPAWLAPLVAAAVFALCMWVLATLMVPDGWHGAALALVGHAAVLGLVLGCLNLASAPTR